MTAQTVRNLSERGVEILIATGRHVDFAMQLTESLDCPRTIVANNGALLFDTGKGRNIFADYLENDVVNRIYQMGRELDLHALFYVDYAKEGTDLIVGPEVRIDGYEKNLVRNVNRIQMMEQMVPDRVLSIVYPGSIEVLTRMARELDDRYGSGLSHHIMAAMYKNNIMEIMNAGVTKWRAISHYAERRGLMTSEIAAFGDEVNDLPMIRGAGMGIAMKNALPIVQQSAKQVTKYTNDESGIAHQLLEIYGE